MNATDIGTMIEYHYWARDRLLDALDPLTAEQFTRDLGSSFKSIRDTVGHTYSAEWAWYSRWRGESPAALLPMDLFPDVGTVRAKWRDLEGQVRAFLRDQGADLNKVYNYKLLNGQPGSTPLWQMVQHVVNHASYHRGQVTTMLRQIGAQPARSMDMIAFYRERA